MKSLRPIFVLSFLFVLGAPVVASAQTRILLATADCGTSPATLRNNILALDPTATVDFFDAGAGTPSVATMQTYDIVVPFSNCGYADPTAMGDNLATYLAGGGTVVAFNFDWYGGSQSLGGAWITGGYSPFNNPGGTNFSAGTLGTYDATSPLMQGVTSLNSYYRETMTLSAGSTLVASWNDSTPLIAVKGNAVGISGYVGDSAGNWSGDFARVILNALNLSAAAPDLTIAKTHTGSFQPAQTGVQYTITVTNSGTAATDGSTVTVTDTPPAGLTITAMSGSGWTCTVGTLTCTRTDVLAAGSSYPDITVTGDIASTATTPFVNQATVSGGGDTNSSNNTASDSGPLVGAIPTLSPIALAIVGLMLSAVMVIAVRR